MLADRTIRRLNSSTRIGLFGLDATQLEPLDPSSKGLEAINQGRHLPVERLLGATRRDENSRKKRRKK